MCYDEVVGFESFSSVDRSSSREDMRKEMRVSWFFGRDGVVEKVFRWGALRKRVGKMIREEKMVQEARSWDVGDTT